MISYWFPTGIFHDDYHDHYSLKNCVLNHIPIDQKLEDYTYQSWGFWEKNMKRGLKDIFSIDALEITNFKNYLESKVDEFSRHYGCENHYRIDQSWINIYEKGDFQESHTHIGFDFSGIYFLSAPKDSSKVIFENPLNIYNMKPLKNKNPSDLYVESAIYESVEGRLLLFRSNLRHGVFPHGSDSSRISLAFNFLSKD